MSYNRSFTSIEHCSVLNETDKAIEVECEGEVVWFPRSQIDGGDKFEAGDEDQTIDFSDWILEQKGWA